MDIGCVIMAAGSSRRFGSNKLTQPLGDRPVLAHVLDALPRDRLAKITAVVSHPETEALCAARHIPVCVNPGGPRSQTVRLGVAAMAGMDGCLFCMGDQPLCTRRSLLALLDIFEAHPGPVVRLSWGDTPGSPVLFPRRLFPRLSALTGSQGGMAAARGEAVLLVPARHAAELWDADTPQALERLRAAKLLLDSEQH